MRDKMNRRKNSGQILLIAAFIMASLLLSAQFYVLEVGKVSSETDSGSLNDFVLVVKMGSRHVVVGSLANISNGGQNSVLEWNLQEWSLFVGSQYQFGKSILNYTLMEAAPYSSGTWTNWGTNGTGISSAYANFTYKLLDRGVDINDSFFTNATTSVLVESSYTMASLITRQVNVTINVLNEAEPALAKQIAVYYKLLDSWLIPDETNNYKILDFGNGTYTASFTTSILFQEEVSVHIVDQRGIYVQANATSTQI